MAGLYPDHHKLQKKDKPRKKDKNVKQKGHDPTESTKD